VKQFDLSPLHWIGDRLVNRQGIAPQCYIQTVGSPYATKQHPFLWRERLAHRHSGAVFIEQA
jgi:hypothetical protein